jgi:AraC-like DNA-binding protein
MTDFNALASAMELVPDTIFFVKDPERRYRAANTELARMCGAPHPNDVVGRRTPDFFPPELVARYDQLDAKIAQGLTLVDRFDRAVDHAGRPVWCLYSRAPLGDGTLIGVSRRLPRFRDSDTVYARLALATDRIAERLDRRRDLDDLAEQAGCSPARLERDFLRVLGVTPARYRMRLRLQLAKDRLKRFAPIADIAAECGFADQSGFTRRFRKATGMTPSRYRAAARAQPIAVPELTDR